MTPDTITLLEILVGVLVGAPLALGLILFLFALLVVFEKAYSFLLNI